MDMGRARVRGSELGSALGCNGVYMSRCNTSCSCYNGIRAGCSRVIGSDKYLYVKPNPNSL